MIVRDGKFERPEDRPVPADATPMRPDRTDLSDEGLALRARHGDARSLVDLARRYVPRVYHLLARTLDDASDAEHAIVDVFLELAARVADSSPQRGGLRSWIFGVAWRHAQAELERRERGIGRILSLESHRPSERDDSRAPDARHAGDDRTDDDSDRIRRALASLAPRLRAVLVLREFEDLSYDEIARVLRTRPQRVRCELRRARFELRDALHDHHPGWLDEHPFAGGDRRCGRRIPPDDARGDADEL